MASSSLHSSLTSPAFLSRKHTPKPQTTTTNSSILIRCGPRSNRGPLVKGRILSSEAILAVQSLKRAYSKSLSSTVNLPDLTRLIKSDLLSILRELLRQDLCPLALQVLSTLRSEHPGHADLSLYGEVISALSRNGLVDDIDRVIDDLESDEGGVQWGSDKGLLRVIRGVVEAGRTESTVKICRILRRNGCGVRWPADRYVVGVLSKGLRGMDEVKLADEVVKEFGGIFRGNVEKLIVN